METEGWLVPTEVAGNVTAVAGNTVHPLLAAVLDSQRPEIPLEVVGTGNAGAVVVPSAAAAVALGVV